MKMMCMWAMAIPTLTHLTSKTVWIKIKISLISRPCPLIIRSALFPREGIIYFLGSLIFNRHFQITQDARSEIVPD